MSLLFGEFCHLLLALRFSATSSRILYILVVLLGGVGVEYHAASWIKVVRYWVAWSSWSASFILVSMSLMYVRKRPQVFAFVISVGIFGLLNAWLLRVAITGVWSDDSWWLDSI
jgi:hypothetical protein